MSSRSVATNPALYRHHIIFILSLLSRSRYDDLGWFGEFLHRILIPAYLELRSHGALANIPYRFAYAIYIIIEV